MYEYVRVYIYICIVFSFFLRLGFSSSFILKGGVSSLCVLFFGASVICKGFFLGGLGFWKGCSSCLRVLVRGVRISG